MTQRGKCKYCCPDGGAIFDIYSHEKICRNCRTVYPRRRIKPSMEPTKSQQNVIQLILKTFGGEITKQEKIGRKLWIVIQNENRHMIMGKSLFGTIGVRGEIKLTLQRLFKDVELRDNIDIRIYLS